LDLDNFSENKLKGVTVIPFKNRPSSGLCTDSLTLQEPAQMAIMSKTINCSFNSSWITRRKKESKEISEENDSVKELSLILEDTRTPRCHSEAHSRISKKAQ
jgi:hypothetical protein